MPRLALCLLLSAALLVAVPGCQDQDAIRTYEVDKQAAVKPQTTEQVPSRMLAAMLRGDRQAWFFKVVGPEDQTSPVAEEVMGFLRGLHFDKEQLRPTWDLPKGWSELPPKQMRLATLTIPTDGEALDLSVIGLGLVGDWDAQVLDNVNRWRGQLGLARWSAEELAAAESEGFESLQVDDRELVLVDLQGKSAPSTGMGGPMAGGMAPFAGAQPPRSPPKPSRPAPPAQSPGPATAHSAGPSYDLPEGWRKLPPTGMRVVNLAVGEGEEQAEVTGSAMAASMPTLSIINVWRGDAGLGTMDEEELEAALQSIEIDGVQAQLIEITPPEADLHVIGVIGVRGSQAWLLKIRGPAATVAQQQDAFREWLGTIKFSE